MPCKFAYARIYGTRGRIMLFEFVGCDIAEFWAHYPTATEDCLYDKFHILIFCVRPSDKPINIFSNLRRLLGQSGQQKKDCFWCDSMRLGSELLGTRVAGHQETLPLKQNRKRLYTGSTASCKVDYSWAHRLHWTPVPGVSSEHVHACRVLGHEARQNRVVADL